MPNHDVTRGFDHLVLCVSDLDAARATYAALGFTVTPRAVHPFGTGNVLVQLQGCFLELLGVVEPDRISPVQPGAFGFADYNRRFLQKREGFSMLALKTEDAAADRETFAAAVLDTYPLFRFERQAGMPDGSKVLLGFTLVFVTDPRMPEAVFFCCRHQHPPAHFWKAPYQHHPNGAIGVREVIMVADDPPAFADFFERLQGAGAVRIEAGTLAVRAASGRIAVLTPDRFERRFAGMVAAGAPAGPRFAGFRVEVVELAEVRTILERSAMPFRAGRTADGVPTLQVGPETAFGTAIEFVSVLGS